MTYALSRRRMLPRWRRVISTLNMKEAQSASLGAAHPIALEADDLNRAIDAWRKNPTSGHLGDVLSFSISTEHVDAVRNVLRESIKDGHLLTPVQHEFSKLLLSDREPNETHGGVLKSAQQLQCRVREVRRLFNADPSNPLILLDLAQLRLASGDVRRSEKLLRSAKQFAPSDRVVLRTSARFLTHVGRVDEAHSLLANHPRTGSDPWLMASEIALAQMAEKQSRFIRIGQRLLKEKSVSHANVTELAGALAGVELSHGNIKRARDYYRQALISPNDNVMAQVVTDQKILSLDAAPSLAHARMNPNEAKALISWGKIDYDGAFEGGVNWHAEEPYSSRPLQFLTSFLGASAKYDDAIVLARRGLVADPGNIGLEVNLAYALASTNDLEEAERLARKVKAADPAKFAALATATMGLIAMKRGDFVKADECYLSALDEFSKSNDRALYAICRAYYARTAFDCGHVNAGAIIDAAVDEYRRQPVPDSAFILVGLGADIDKRAEERVGLKRAVQWEFDMQKAELIRRNVLVDSNSPVIVKKA